MGVATDTPMFSRKIRKTNERQHTVGILEVSDDDHDDTISRLVSAQLSRGWDMSVMTAQP